MTDAATLFIGELAERTGLSRDAIRHYEAVGVLPKAERSDGGYRLFGAEDVDRLTFVGRAQALGLTLEAIADILDLVDEGREPCAHVRRRLAARLDETRRRIGELRGLEGRLEAALERAERETPAAEACRCGIIEGAPEAPASGGKRHRTTGFAGRDHDAR